MGNKESAIKFEQYKDRCDVWERAYAPTQDPSTLREETEKNKKVHLENNNEYIEKTKKQFREDIQLLSNWEYFTRYNKYILFSGRGLKFQKTYLNPDIMDDCVCEAVIDIPSTGMICRRDSTTRRGCSIYCEIDYYKQYGMR